MGFKWPWSNKLDKVTKALSPSYRCNERSVDLNVGVVQVELKFADKRKLVTKVYGDASQYVYGNRVDPIKIISATQASIGFLRNLVGDTGGYYDDPRDPKVCYVGKVISAKLIGKESDHKIAFTELFLEEIKNV